MTPPQPATAPRGNRLAASPPSPPSTRLTIRAPPHAPSDPRHAEAPALHASKSPVLAAENQPSAPARPQNSAAAQNAQTVARSPDATAPHVQARAPAPTPAPPPPHALPAAPYIA